MPVMSPVDQLLSIIKPRYYRVVCFSHFLTGRGNRRLEETRN